MKLILWKNHFGKIYKLPIHQGITFLAFCVAFLSDDAQHYYTLILLKLASCEYLNCIL